MRYLFWAILPLSIGTVAIIAVPYNPLTHDSPTHIRHILFLRAGELSSFNIYILSHSIPYLLSFFIGAYKAVLISPVIYSGLFILGIYLLALTLDMDDKGKWLIMCLATAILPILFPFYLGFSSYITGLVFPLYLALFFKAVKTQRRDYRLGLVLATILTAFFHPQLLQACLLFLVVATIVYRQKTVTAICSQSILMAIIYAFAWYSQWGFYRMPAELATGVSYQLSGGFYDRIIVVISSLIKDGIMPSILVNGILINMPIEEYILMQFYEYWLFLVIACMGILSFIWYRTKEYATMRWMIWLSGVMYLGYLLAVSNDGLYILSRMYYVIPSFAVPLMGLSLETAIKWRDK